MEPIVGSLLNLGIGGCMAAAVLWIVYNLVERTIPNLLNAQRDDLRAARQEFKESLGQLQADFRDALIRQQDTFRGTIERIEGRWQAAVDALCVKIEAVDRHTKNNTDHTLGMQKIVIEMLQSRQQPPRP